MRMVLGFILMTFRRPSEIYYIAPGQNRVVQGLHCSFSSLLLGWWGFPWGPVYTIQTFWTNFRGGMDITDAFTAEPPPSDTPPELPSH